MPRRPVEPPADAEPNARTVSSYEVIAAEYARDTAGGGLSDGLTRLLTVVPGSNVLEIGSGPGWDADALEEAGLRVRRTDITQAFIDLQQERGKSVDRLDVVVDDLGGPYDGIVCLAVLQHIPKDLLPGVLTRMAGALEPAGALLIALRTGAGERWEIGESGNPYFCAMWGADEFLGLLAAVGLDVVWQNASIDSENSDWLTLVGRVGLEPTPKG